MEYRFYNTGYISDREKNERKIQNIDTQEDPLRNILGRCKSIEKENNRLKDVIDPKGRPIQSVDVPSSENGWKTEERITSTKYLNWNPASGWSNGYADKKENFTFSSTDSIDRPFGSKENFESEISYEISLSELPNKDATVFGPKLWYCLHNAAKAYPDSPTKLVQDRMKNVILGIPYLIPCDSCYEHSLSYIDKLDECKLNNICSTRINLIVFFVEFHNHVNKRLGKKIYKIVA
jgi:hypothetical protein